MSKAKNTLSEASEFLTRALANESLLARVDAAGLALAASLKAGNKAISCGNGGSMCDAMHFAEELTGRFRDNRQALPAMAISDPSHLTCLANDFGFDQVFSRYVEAHGKLGDCLLAISTSGSSENVLNAATKAKELGITVIALTGAPDSKLGKVADFDLAVGASNYSDRIQEVHIKLIHALIEIVEDELF